MQNNYELFMVAYPVDSQMSEKISEVLMNNSDIDIWACAFEIEATESIKKGFALMNLNSVYFRFYFYAAFYFRKRAFAAVLIP